jgi:hypothetical protein
MLVLLLLLSSVACGGDRKAQKLDRATALALIKEAQKNNATTAAELDKALYKPMEPVVILWKQNAGDADGRDLYDAQVKFIRLFANKGWFKEIPCPPDVVAASASSACFDAARPDIRKGQLGMLEIMIGKPSDPVVTGITQKDNSNEAEAEVKVSVSPTEMYKESLVLIESAKSYHPAGGRFDNTMVWNHWPAESELRQTHTLTFGFTRYDDGWRINAPWR